MKNILLFMFVIFIALTRFVSALCFNPVTGKWQDGFDCTPVADSYTPTHTPTISHTPTDTWTASASPTQTPTFTKTGTPTETATRTSTSTSTPSLTSTPTTGITVTTDTPTLTPTHTPTWTPTDTPTVTDTPTQTPTGGFAEYLRSDVSDSANGGIYDFNNIVNIGSPSYYGGGLRIFADNNCGLRIRQNVCGIALNVKGVADPDDEFRVYNDGVTWIISEHGPITAPVLVPQDVLLLMDNSNLISFCQYTADSGVCEINQGSQTNQKTAVRYYDDSARVMGWKMASTPIVGAGTTSYLNVGIATPTYIAGQGDLLVKDDAEILGDAYCGGTFSIGTSCVNYAVMQCVNNYYTETLHNVYWDSGWKSRGGGPGARIAMTGGSSSVSSLVFATDSASTGIAAGAASSLAVRGTVHGAGWWQIGAGTPTPRRADGSGDVYVVDTIEARGKTDFLDCNITTIKYRTGVASAAPPCGSPCSTGGIMIYHATDETWTRLYSCSAGKQTYFQITGTTVVGCEDN